MSVQVEQNVKLEEPVLEPLGRARKSLARRVLRVVLGLYFTIAISITALQLILEYTNERDRLVDEIEQVAQTFRPIVLQALWNLDDTQIQASLEGILGTNKDVLSVEVRDVSGSTTHFVDRKTGTAVTPEQAAQRSSTLVERYYFEFDLLYSNEFTGTQNLGSLIFVTNSNVVLKRASHTFYITIISAFLKTTILCLIFYIAVKKMIGGPMEYLSTVMAKMIPSTGAYNSKIELDKKLLAREDEIGYVLNTFQTMKDAIQQKENALREYQSQLENKVAERTKQLEAVSRAKSDFLASMSHEIRTPMNGVLGMVQLLADTRLDEQQAKYINIIQNSGESLIEIINGILDHLKIEAGKIELEIREINLEKIVDDCINMFSFKSRETGVAIIPAFNPACPTWVRGDAMRIKQILNNLVGNAFKFTHEGEVVIKVEKVRDLEKNQALVRFSVCDTGIGIDDENISRLFQPFNQADKSTTRKYGGTGLGLTISKQLVELMGGKIKVSSELGKGSVFEFDLPFEPCQPSTEETELGGDSTAVLKGKRLLVIDDHNAFGTMISEITDAWGMKVQSVTLGDQGKIRISKAIAEKEPFDVAIVDIALPDMNGLLLCKELYDLHGEAMPKVMLVSAVKTVSSDICLQEHGVAVFVEKPISNAELRNTLIRLVAEKQSHIKPHSNGHAENYSQLKVLVAEDNLVNQMVIRGLLNKRGIEPDIAENGFKAIEACENNAEQPYDLILMDCEMPELDGWEASKKIRALNYQRSDNTPVSIHALSAHAMEQHLDRAREAGMDGYMYKPVNMDALTKLLKQVADSLRC